MCKGGSALATEDQWIAKVNLEEFKREIRDLGKKLLSEQGPEDVAHLEKIICWSNMFATVGLLTMWYSPNIVSVFCLSTWTFSRWTMIAHHVCHGGYDTADKTKRFNRFKFAVGGLFNRMHDWFDWMLPEAWNVEHNNMHHYSLGEKNDPDLVEWNLADVRKAEVSLWVKYLFVSVQMVVWKWFYYAPNTYKELKLAKLRRENKPVPEGMCAHVPATIRGLLNGQAAWFSPTDFFINVIGPYLIFHFFILPLPFYFLSPVYFWNAVANLFLAEMLTNIHSFVAIVTNHAGDDMYKFDSGCIPKSGTFYLRQVISSVNFTTGSDLNDFFHGFLNYQIEHHLWPNLSMLSYQKAQPLVKEICGRHGIPYVQQSVFWRLYKTVRIMVGEESMRPFPSSMVVEADKSHASREEMKAEGGVAFASDDLKKSE